MMALAWAAIGIGLIGVLFTTTGFVDADIPARHPALCREPVLKRRARRRAFDSRRGCARAFGGGCATAA